MATLETRLTIERLHPLFVAEVTGIDLTRPMSHEDFRTIWDAFNEHQILVFRDQAFDDESQIAFSRSFGELEMMVAHPGNDWNPGHISVMTNLEDAGTECRVEGVSAVFPLTGDMHVDSTGRYLHRRAR